MARGATGELTPAEVRSRHGAFIRRANLVSTEISQLPIRTVLAILLFARTHSIPTVLDVDVPPSDAIAIARHPRRTRTRVETRDLAETVQSRRA